MSLTTWIESAATGLVCALVTTVLFGWWLARRRRRQEQHGIDIRLTGPAGVLLNVDCEQLGLLYTYARDGEPHDLGGRPLQRDAAGWMTLEVLPTAAGLLLLQCRPAPTGAR